MEDSQDLVLELGVLPPVLVGSHILLESLSKLIMVLKGLKESFLVEAHSCLVHEVKC